MNYLSPELKAKYKYTTPDDFKWCKLGGTTEVPGLNDDAEFKDFREAWEMLGVPNEEVGSVYSIIVPLSRSSEPFLWQVGSVYSIISGILHLGNIDFEAGGGGSAAAIPPRFLRLFKAFFYGRTRSPSSRFP
jgi:myosin heavy subunit